MVTSDFRPEVEIQPFRACTISVILVLKFILVFVFISFCIHHFYFYIISVLS